MKMLDRLAVHRFYGFLEGKFGDNQIVVALEDQEETTFPCPFKTFGFRGCHSVYVMP